VSLGPTTGATIIYNLRRPEHGGGVFGETSIPQAGQPADKSNTMGDKSPKSTQKKSSQKQAKANTAASKKQQAVAAKQAGGKKK
jgi:hypothetical protein